MIKIKESLSWFVPIYVLAVTVSAVTAYFIVVVAFIGLPSLIIYATFLPGSLTGVDVDDSAIGEPSHYTTS